MARKRAGAAVRGEDRAGESRLAAKSGDATAGARGDSAAARGHSAPVPRDQARARRAMFWRMVLRSVTRRRSRVLIAVLAVGIGATTLFALASIATDIPRQMTREMRAYGANLLVMPEDGAGKVPAAALEPIAGVLESAEVIGSAPYRYETLRLNEQPYLTAGTDLEAVRQVSPYWYVEGDWPAGPGEVLIGQDIAEWIGLAAGDQVELVAAVEATPGDNAGAGAEDGAGNGGTASGGGDGPGAAGGPDGDGAGAEDGAGSRGTASGTGEDPDGEAEAVLEEEAVATFTVAGVLSTGGSEDELILMGLRDLEEFTGVGGQYDVVEYSVAADAGRIETLAKAIGAEVAGVAAAPVKRLTESDTYVLSMLRSLLALITVIVLALTMIGVSTTMMAVVAERQGEIALRKALGASNREVEREFLSEGLALGAVGGLVGTGLGYLLAQVISLNVFHRGVAMTWWLALAAVGLSTLVAWAAALVPVRRAAEVDPAIVLRGE
ncbi:MAG: FtsX-like permease family protein [Bifidobacteriaceae bacterium]|jgi:putative ABC transport system permease protein|nr:FtsX-like permease family protein [Bifidobacteriaceae bacterium]